MRISNGVLQLGVAVALALPGTLTAQSTAVLTGHVTKGDGEALTGVQVVVTNENSGSQTGALTRSDGVYVVAGLRVGAPYRVEARMIGYGLEARSDVVLAAGQTHALDFHLSQQAIPMDAIEVFATRARERTTAVAYSDVKKVQIQNQLGSQDIPMVLNTTPSVYATMQGGGAGDARINIRGFDQRNLAVMINGVPVNDMENGWVYWSDWDGLGDDAASIQVQRGLSAVNLTTPSIGGTLNVITDPTAHRPGFSYKQELGDGTFLKETLTANTGVHDGFAFTGSFSRKTGDGIFGYTGGSRRSATTFGDATWTSAWSYYVAASYQINDNNRLEFYALNAPQSHGQNLYKLNVATLSHSYARKLGYSDSALAAFPEAGRYWSPNVALVSPSYKGKQYASSGPEAGTFARHGSNYINERENYFEKPQVNLNYYSHFGNGFTWSTVAYYAGGAGGGSGALGSVKWNYEYGQRFADWNATIANNEANTDGHSSGILRNSVNNQWTLGAISKLRKTLGSGVTGEVGVDWRTATIDHYRDIRDLLGGQYWIDNADQFTGPRQATFGDKIDYYNTNRVNWLGFYAQAEKRSRAGSVYGMVGYDQNSYSYADHFKKDPVTGGELKLNSGTLHGYQIKGRLERNVTPALSLFANAGWISKVPNFDGAIDDVNGAVLPDPKNETFLSFEAGARYRALDRRLSFDLDLYHTTWRNRTQTIYQPGAGGGDDIIANLLGVDERHMGVELQGAYQPSDLIRFDASASFGDWTYLNDANGRIVSGDRQTSVDYAFYIKGLKVSDQPQMQFSYSASLYPVAGLMLQFQGRSNYNYYAAFSPFDRTTSTDRKQPWKTPGYTVFDFHGSLRFTDLIPAWRGGDVRLFANVFNVFNTVYVQDATDDSRYNGYYSDGSHNAESAEVYLGLPRTYNVGFQVMF